ncbi:MAG: hypothetical protein M3Y87_35075, partial [Myxococcota bacterium]|nr:hypothetical protein [Myxococcota bacterium]
MRATYLLLAIPLLVVAGCDAGTPATDAGATCEPACRSGFACVRGECVSACNPACGAGERCTDEG